jgi:Tfp pilus assembly protein PilX
MWKWLTGVFISLIAILRIVTYQRDRARQTAKQAQAEAEATAAIREAEQRIAAAQAKSRQAAEKVQNELDSQKHNRPTNDFGDSRLRLRDNKDGA